MAPRKEKASANEAADMVLHYLRKQNRPYSALEVSANLHNKVTKAAAAKLLKDLHEQKQIEGRPAGKQIVYHAIQDPTASCTAEQLAALETNITSLRNQATHLTATAKILRSTLSSLNSELSTADLIATVHALEAEKAEISARLESLKAGKAKKVTKEQREQVEKEWKRCVGVARRRERVARECWRFVEDQVQDREKAAELREGMGLDD
ncbi:Tat binding protein 1-interacting [Paraphoma chrysanthemicola]|uniref:Tat binding protein 1-interacting n=1 Tax=Paraphoma chrysanthemicola TaxID=798071 RepID=A0A8K0RHK0_9PLEO|nr:Tat binding protein 1-interacting [Paraphoma chrysanthemicola]